MNIFDPSPCLQFLENPRVSSWVQASWDYILARRPENDDVLERPEKKKPSVGMLLPCPSLNVVDDIRIERIDLAADLIVAEVESEIEGQSEDSTSTEEVPALTHKAISSQDSQIHADALMARNPQRAERRLRQLYYKLKDGTPASSTTWDMCLACLTNIFYFRGGTPWGGGP